MLAGCASDPGRYPSLAIRDFERVQGQFEVGGGISALPAPAAPSPATVARVSALLEEANRAHGDFLAAVGETERLLVAARDLNPESNLWSEAQIALAVLDTRRALVATRLADLDLLLADASLAYEQLGEIEAARSAVAALTKEEDLVLDRLTSIDN
ncbi:MAG: hypothetical protein C0510_08970 [Erythrobacter sp.]|nr:hypothetical protein [Erythrobacter sp.]